MTRVGSRTSSRDERRDPLAYEEIEAAIRALHSAVWDRWHPRNPETQGHAPDAVQAALCDLRPLAAEASALWAQLGRVLREQPLTRAQIKALKGEEVSA